MNDTAAPPRPSSHLSGRAGVSGGHTVRHIPAPAAANRIASAGLPRRRFTRPRAPRFLQDPLIRQRKRLPTRVFRVGALTTSGGRHAHAPSPAVLERGHVGLTRRASRAGAAQRKASPRPSSAPFDIRRGRAPSGKPVTERLTTRSLIQNESPTPPAGPSPDPRAPHGEREGTRPRVQRQAAGS